LVKLNFRAKNDQLQPQETLLSNKTGKRRENVSPKMAREINSG
jgi:hypothetical protein